jgi:hypothetical protein
MIFQVRAPSVSNSTKLRIRSSRPAGVKTSVTRTSSWERPCIPAGSIRLPLREVLGLRGDRPDPRAQQSETPITST